MNAGRRLSLQIALASAMGALTGCGFRPRGALVPAFQELGSNLSTRNGVGALLRQQLQQAGVALLSPTNQPDGIPVLMVETDQREKSIIAKTVDGQVRELQLRVRFVARVSDNNNREWMPRTEWVLTQNLGYNETLAYGKELEEAMMMPKMEQDIADQVMRRLSVLRPPAP